MNSATKTKQPLVTRYEFGRKTYTAYVVPGETVRIETAARRAGEKDRWEIGDSAIKGSYILIHTGTVTKIGPRTVTVEAFGQTKRLSLLQFVRLNRHYNQERIDDHNRYVCECA